jgi:hypothetical protein
MFYKRLTRYPVKQLDITTKERTFLENLERFSRRLLWLRLIGALWRFALLLLVLWSSVVMADQLFHFSELSRWGLWIIDAVIVVYLFIQFLI